MSRAGVSPALATRAHDLLEQQAMQVTLGFAGVFRQGQSVMRLLTNQEQARGVVLRSMFHTGFERLETQAAMAQDVSAALATLITTVAGATDAAPPTPRRQEIEGMVRSLQAHRLALVVADDAQPPLGKSPMQHRKIRFAEAALAGLTAVLTKPAP